MRDALGNEIYQVKVYHPGEYWFDPDRVKRSASENQFAEPLSEQLWYYFKKKVTRQMFAVDEKNYWVDFAVIFRQQDLWFAIEVAGPQSSSKDTQRMQALRDAGWIIITVDCHDAYNLPNTAAIKACQEIDSYLKPTLH